jgi:hypothetical protein
MLVWGGGGVAAWKEGGEEKGLRGGEGRIMQPRSKGSYFQAVAEARGRSEDAGRCQ